MANKSDERPGKNKDVTPGTVRRRRNGEPDSPSVPSKCWTFELEKPSAEARQIREGQPLSGSPKDGLLEVLSNQHGIIGYAPPELTQTILQRSRETQIRHLRGVVVESGERVLVELCLEGE
jgi:hypothetical protein